MPGRHSQSETCSSTTGKRAALAAGVGVAGLAAIVTGPLTGGAPAGAATAPTTTTSTTTAASTTAASTTTAAPARSRTTVSTAASAAAETTAPVAPDYGTQKYRIGVERDDANSEIPKTINTAGSKAHVVETKPDGSTYRVFDCVTVDDTPTDAADATYCPGESISALRQGRTRPQARTEPGPPYGAPGVYFAAPGVTVTVTQTTVVDGLLIDTETNTLTPCESTQNYCRTDSELSESSTYTSTDLLFTDKGLPPTAVDDAAETPQDTPVTIDVAANDFAYGADDTYDANVTGLEVGKQPAHGTAKVGSSESGDGATALRIAAGTAPSVVYTPNSGFSGKDTFTYRLLTRNGASTATVTVTVPGGTTTTTTAPASSASPASASLGILDENATRTPNAVDDGVLAATGDTSVPLVGYGIVLLGGGVAAVAVGRHRRGRPGRAH